MTFLDQLEALIVARLRAEVWGGGFDSPKDGDDLDVVGSGRREQLRTGAAFPRPRLYAIGRSNS